jgi:hypothetical protein
MSRQIIYSNSAPILWSTVDEAFNRINDNFTELYNALGLDADTLNLGAFEFSGSVMTTTDSTPIVIDQATSITSDLTVGGDIVPNANLGGNLGSPTRQWRSLYVSTNTIYINNIPLSIDANNNLTVNGSPVEAAVISEVDGGAASTWISPN